jgi:hypothetical protein
LLGGVPKALASLVFDGATDGLRSRMSAVPKSMPQRKPRWRRSTIHFHGSLNDRLQDDLGR